MRVARANPAQLDLFRPEGARDSGVYSVAREDSGDGHDPVEARRELSRQVRRGAGALAPGPEVREAVSFTGSGEELAVPPGGTSDNVDEPRHRVRAGKGNRRNGVAVRGFDCGPDVPIGEWLASFRRFLREAHPDAGGWPRSTPLIDNPERAAAAVARAMRERAEEIRRGKRKGETPGARVRPDHAPVSDSAQEARVTPHPDTCRCVHCDPDDARNQQRELAEAPRDLSDDDYDAWPTGGPEGMAE